MFAREFGELFERAPDDFVIVSRYMYIVYNIYGGEDSHGPSVCVPIDSRF